ncbi:hypothetical protein DYL72_15390 [Vibrio anguillarum]|uniref:ParB/Spo0J HTH domain-containing protein n=1 Tax=Vibrio anguillarum TaxID=55601 RepID=A0A7U6FS42_VIBAN|nr:hypothetical protein [Vibrio anguillarum]AZS26291.1 hypothetical protein DYL72_15390 [Vibrio anguillarum]
MTTTSAITFTKAAKERTLSNTLKEQGINCSRNDSLRIPFSSLYVKEGWNIRSKLDMAHVAKLVKAFSNGTKPSDFVVQPCEINGQTRFLVIGGHHTHKAVEILINDPKNIKFTNETLFDVELFHGEERNRLVKAYNANQGLQTSLLDKARTFQRMRLEGMTNKEISDETGERPSVISNALFILSGDAKLIELIEEDKISGTRAMQLLREHGAEKATAFAMLELKMYDQSQTQTQNEEAQQHAHNSTQTKQQSVIENSVSGEATAITNSTNEDLGTTAVAAKKTTKNALKTKKLTEKQIDELLSVVAFLSERVTETEDGVNINDIPKAIAEKMTKPSELSASIKTHNANITKLTESI